MSIHFKSAFLSAAVVALTLQSAVAQDAGPYVSGAVGLLDVPSASVTDTVNRNVKFDNGYLGALALGYDYAGPWRSEIELSRRSAGLDSVSGTNASGNLKATSLMGNVLYDFNTNSKLTPYLGLGVGGTRVKMDNASPFGTSSINDTDNALAAQAIAGLSYALQDNMDVFADYHYFRTRDLDMRTVAGTKASFDVDTHSIMVGLRYNFGAPKAQPKPAPVTPVAMAEPAPAPAPAPRLPSNYIVFFDWNKDAITPEAAEIIRTAAANAGTMGKVRMVLTGHTDTSGSAKYNLKLSQRRGNAVRAQFEALGFTNSDIQVISKGEAEQLVPTDDGVREPQNRRVEIVLP